MTTDPQTTTATDLPTEPLASLPPKTAPTEAAAPHINSVDATTGQPMLARVNARTRELETLLTTLPESDVDTRAAINHALDVIATLTTGDLSTIPPVVVNDMNNWLERSKHLGE